MKKIAVFLVPLVLASLAIAQGHGGPRKFRFAGADGGSMVQLALRPDVQKEIAATDEEKAKLADLEERMQAQVQADFEAMAKANESDPNKMRGKIGATGDTFAEELPKILTVPQTQRLHELLIQKVGDSALLRKDVQQELGLTDAQLAQVADAEAGLLKAFDGMLNAEKPLTRDEMRAVSAKAMADRNEKLQKMLTDKQKADFKAMAGKPFTFEDQKPGASEALSAKP
ncbi:MAG: hypothetical protein QOJ65_873 [Fimbriimonadaceae bacterium]|nr:hypothetical protein [Fimbriimonadaceae bacterium]